MTPRDSGIQRSLQTWAKLGKTNTLPQFNRSSGVSICSKAAGTTQNYGAGWSSTVQPQGKEGTVSQITVQVLGVTCRLGERQAGAVRVILCGHRTC